MTTLILFLSVLVTSNVFSTNVESAFDHFEAGNYTIAAQLLDESAALEPDQFSSNNLHYLRGRIAENLQDWDRADADFSRIGSQSVLYAPALAHRVRVALEDQRYDDARTLFETLPRGLPDRLRMEIAGHAPEAFALEIYGSIRNRESEWKQAEIRQDFPAMWRLLERNRTDDIALRAARALDGTSSTPDQALTLADTFYAHRFFDQAAPLYASLLEDPSHGAEAHYQLGRTHFQLGRYDDAIGFYRATVLRFPETDWEEEADFQIASAYWRKLDFSTAAAAYLALIEKYRDDRRRRQSAIRDLIDIYRALGNESEAKRWIATGLDSRPSNTDRAVLVFSRAKIEYSEGLYEDALRSFQQLANMNLRNVPNGTNRAEVRFLEALTLERLGRSDQARHIWTDLAEDPFSYYGMKAARKLADSEAPYFELQQVIHRTIESPSIVLCGRGSEETARATIRNRRLGRTRGLEVVGRETDLVGELVFLRLWDEAFYWANLNANRWRDEALADLAYLASDYRRAMLYADRLRPADEMLLFSFDEAYSDETEALLMMLYPTAFWNIICRESAEANVDPLWLHAIAWQESRYDPTARSGAAARGLMQFIPETAAEVARQLGMQDLDVESLYQPELSIQLGAHYWAALIAEVKDPELALAAYNGGMHNVRRWRAKLAVDDVALFVSDIGFSQTKDYVQQVFSLYAKYMHLMAASD